MSWLIDYICWVKQFLLQTISRNLIKQKEQETLKLRKNKSLESYEHSKMIRAEELKKREEAKSKVCQFIKNSYLYKKMYERYNKEVVVPVLEERKKELACKRSNLRPITKEILDEQIGRAHV